jgi:hypothetical protein
MAKSCGFIFYCFIVIMLKCNNNICFARVVIGYSRKIKSINNEWQTTPPNDKKIMLHYATNK